MMAGSCPFSVQGDRVKPPQSAGCNTNLRKEKIPTGNLPKSELKSFVSKKTLYDLIGPRDNIPFLNVLTEYFHNIKGNDNPCDEFGADRFTTRSSKSSEFINRKNKRNKYSSSNSNYANSLRRKRLETVDQIIPYVYRVRYCHGWSLGSAYHLFTTLMWVVFILSVLGPLNSSPGGGLLTEAYSSTYNAQDFSRNVTQLLDKLLDNYDKKIRPGFGGENLF